MGQTLPALCTDCGGKFILDGTPDQQKPEGKSVPQDIASEGLEFVPNVQWDDARKARLANRIVELTKQRNELLDALKEALPKVPCGSFTDDHLKDLAAAGHMTAEMILRHRATIANVEEGPHDAGTTRGR